jgi:[ribosomal protein S5]-alanine N-acetyltransferase
MHTLETERLTIRNFQPEDWEALYEMIVQYEASELGKYDQPWPTDPEQVKGVAGWFASGDNFVAVCLKDTGRFIGFVSLNQEEKENCREFNLGYIFNSDYHGKGYATEASRAVVGRAFGELQADRVITGTAAANTASCRLLEKLGFHKTSESRGSFQNAPDGTPYEFMGYMFALEKDEWKG